MVTAPREERVLVFQKKNASSTVAKFDRSSWMMKDICSLSTSPCCHRDSSSSGEKKSVCKMYSFVNANILTKN